MILQPFDAYPSITLGRQNDNNAIGKVFPIAKFIEEFGAGGNWYLLNQRPGETREQQYAIPPSQLIITDETLTWVVSSYDVEKEGHGRCELAYYVDDVRKMDVIYTTCVEESMVDSGIVPDPWQAWLDQLDAIATRAEDAADAASQSAENAHDSEVNAAESERNAAASETAAEDAADRAEAAAIHQPIIGDNDNWWIWNPTTQQYEDTGVPATQDLSNYAKLNNSGDDTDMIADNVRLIGSDGNNGGAGLFLEGANHAANLDAYDQSTGHEGSVSAGPEAVYIERTDNAGHTSDVVADDLGAHLYYGDESDPNAPVHHHVSVVESGAYYDGEEIATKQEDTSPITDQIPYNQRNLAAEPFDFKKPSYVGGTIAWNQLVQATDTSCTVPSGHRYISFLSGAWAVGSSSGSAFTVDGANGDMVFDLTLMFGAAIANYIYGLGNINGVAYFRALFPSATYDYNAGSLYSVCPNYAIMQNSDASQTASYGLNHPTLRGLFKLDGSNNLFCDGDTYTNDGTITRKYGIVNLGDLNWNYQSTRRIFYSSASLPNCPTVSGAARINGIASIYAIDTSNHQYDNSPDMTLSYGSSIQSQRVNVVNDAYTDPTAFKTAMNGVYLVYLLSSDTTETADAYVEKQTVFQGGTEALTDYEKDEGHRDVAVPVGHNTKYYREMIQVPAPPTSNGSYTLTATVFGGVVTFTWA